MDESGFILSDDYRKTNVAGLFVAGDVCANNVIKQIVSAASDGAVASLSANDYIKKSFN
jgi:thioredoxin reductase (NADPH)